MPFVVFLFLVTFFVFPLPAFAQPAGIIHVNQVIGRVITSLLGLIGTAFVLMLVYGGYLFLSAGSNKDTAVKAKHTLMYALIGVVVSIAGWITLSMLGNFLGYNFGTFNICITGGCT